MLCNHVGLVDSMVVLLVLQVQMAVDCVMIFSFTDCTPRCLAILHVEWEIFHRVISVFLENVAKGLGLYELNVLSAIFLSTVIFRMAGRQAFGAPDLLILEA